MNTIRRCLGVVLVLLAVGCGSEAPEETVTEHGELCVNNLSGTYVATWVDGARGPISMDMRLSTYIASCAYVVPMGNVVGGMSWFSSGPHDTVIGAFGSNQAWWNGSRTVFYANDPVGNNEWRWTCTYAGTHAWNCLFDEYSSGTWYRDGTFTLR